MIDLILVPQGAEYQSVCKGLTHVVQPIPQVVAIPVGIQPVTRYLQHWQQHSDLQSIYTVLIMGLCGSLNPSYGVGDVVLYENCLDQQRNLWQGDRTLNAMIQSRLEAPLVQALTSDRLIASAQDKQILAQTSGADIVDMEGTAILKTLEGMNLAIATLRVVSDDCHHDLPDLNRAIDANGSLRPLPMAWGMIRQPIAATRLIRGSLKGLKTLQTATTILFS
ncbi:5'-methylthioadenosine/S-adenosylhomocysteine nucleosidase family protein [Egbenema bharatensis]|uniref:5'-methylthioadenosine/S-adenosylhomocysteine nucleosidase family protein n=1 Tax=Egbenema bharatensis TaxID=3463334 RepID=UPI003A8A39CF